MTAARGLGRWAGRPRGQIAVLAGLTGVAIAQPLLDLLGRNPEFFVAGHYTTGQIVLFGALVVVVPIVVAAVAVAAPSAVDPRAGTVAFVVLVAVLGALFGTLVLNTLGVEQRAVTLAGAALAAAATLLVTRARAGRLLLQYLAVANVLFVAGFLLTSPTSRLLSSGTDTLGATTVPPLPGPVVVIVLDELPVASLLTSDGTINAERYPSFARLAAGSTWFRNASSRNPITHLAIPALLTGTIPDVDDLPTFQDHPRNLLSLLGTSMPVERYELVTDLCPPSSCAPPPPQPLSQAVHDAGVVYLHRALPAWLRDGLPAIDHAWGGFGDELGGDVAPAEISGEPADPFARWKSIDAADRRAPAQAAALVEQVEAVTAAPELHFVHVALPHFPWILSPAGTRLMEYPRGATDPADPAYERSGLLPYQLHSMQLGATDVALGQLLDHLEGTGIWDDTTFVLVSDHGTSLLQPDLGRNRTPANEQELFRIPMFIKAPGQRDGEVRDDPAQSIDLLPTLVDLLDIETTWEFDGHSLLDGSKATVDPLVGTAVEPLFDVVRAHEAHSPRAAGGSRWRRSASTPRSSGPRSPR
ncbi:MAG: sulfatase-like hydrolase/transferase [Acidimicrobiales bacterium]